jgi:hypothetical protein
MPPSPGFEDVKLCCGGVRHFRQAVFAAVSKSCLNLAQSNMPEHRSAVLTNGDTEFAHRPPASMRP